MDSGLEQTQPTSELQAEILGGQCDTHKRFRACASFTTNPAVLLGLGQSNIVVAQGEDRRLVCQLS